MFKFKGKGISKREGVCVNFPAEGVRFKTIALLKINLWIIQSRTVNSPFLLIIFTNQTNILLHYI